jgi:hypothetical protein
MKDTGGLDSDLPQLPDPGSSAVTERVQEVNELVRHLWNVIHGVNSRPEDPLAGDPASRAVVRDLKRDIMQSIERLPADYARLYNSAVIAVYSLLR